MKVSVIIPAYNEETRINNCLQSLISQIEKADEIIVIDNNCSDKTVQIAKNFPVRIVKEKKQGMINARNRGFDEAKYDILARTDADTILPSDWIKKIKENFEKEKIDALTGPAIFYDITMNSKYIFILYHHFMKLIQKGKETLSGPNMAISKEIWKKVRNDICLDDKKVHEDIDLAIHINKAGGIIKRDDELLIKASGRRLKSNPASFYIEYPLRLLKTFFNH